MEKVNSIINSVNNMSTQGLKTAQGMQFTPTEYQVDTSKARAWEKLGRLADWAKAKGSEQEQDISERLRMQYGPELAKMYREGKVPAQLNDATIRGLKFRAAQEAMTKVADEFNQQVSKGGFNNINDMQAALHKERQDTLKTVATTYGWDENDTDLLDGFTRGSDQLGMQLVGNLLKWQSEKTESVQQVQISQMHARVFEQPSLMYSGEAAQETAKQLQRMYDMGETNFNTFQTMVFNSVNDAVAYEGSVNYLESLEKQTINVEGFSGTYKEFIGADKWELLKAKAGQTQTNLDAKFMEDVELKLAQVSSMNDLNQASQMIADIKSQVNYRYANERMNPIRNSIIGVEKQLVAKQQLQVQAIQREQFAKQQEMADYNNIAQRYRMAINNETVSLDPSNIPNMNKERFVKAANAIIDSINKSEVLSPEEKARQLNEYLRVDRAEGPITAIMKDTADRAMTELNAMIINGAMPSDPKYAQSFNSMKAMYDANPSLISMRFPELSAQLFAMEQAMNLGIPQETYMAYQQQMSTMSKEMRFESDKAWQTATEKSPYLGLSYLPKELNDAARIVYETTLATTKGGNNGTTMALKAAGEFAKKVAWKYDADKTTGKYSQDVYGAIPKSFLQVDTNSDSVKTGQDYLTKQVDILRKLAPLQNITMRYVQTGDYVLLTASDGTHKRVYKEDLSGALVDAEQQAEHEKAIREASLIKGSKLRQTQGAANQFYNENVHYE